MIRATACLLVIGAGCFSRLEPDVGAPLHAACENVIHDPSRDVSYAADISPIFGEYHCLDCHTPAGRTPIGYEVTHFDLSSYDTLRVGGARSGMQIVVTGQPCQSVLFEKVADGPPFGSRMPLNGPPYLGGDDLDVLSDWILEGARDN